MKGRHKEFAHPHHCGLSLLELLVSLAIGLVLVLAAASAYIGAANASRMTEAQARMNEDAQAALAILTQQLRMAGNNPDQPDRIGSTRRNPVYGPSSLATTFPLTAFAIRGCTSTFSNIKTAARLDELTCVNGTGHSPHSIALTYEADRFNTVPTAKSIPTDCLGNALDTETATLATVTETGATITSSLQYHVADNRFYIGRSTAGASPSLYCKGSGGAPQPLVENIEDMQFSYGTASAIPPATGSIAGYLRAEALPGDDAARWAQVVSVHICILVRSEKPVVNEPASARYLNCDGTLETRPPDLRLRRVYSTTVALRNRVGAPLPVAAP